MIVSLSAVPRAVSYTIRYCSHTLFTRLLRERHIRVIFERLRQGSAFLLSRTQRVSRVEPGVYDTFRIKRYEPYRTRTTLLSSVRMVASCPWPGYACALDIAGPSHPCHARRWLRAAGHDPAPRHLFPRCYLPRRDDRSLEGARVSGYGGACGIPTDARGASGGRPAHHAEPLSCP